MNVFWHGLLLTELPAVSIKKSMHLNTVQHKSIFTMYYDAEQCVNL